MKRFVMIVVVLALTGAMLSAEQRDPIADAQAHAMIDMGEYRATGWGAMAFGASVLFSPLLGGGGVIVAANMVTPAVPLPPSRMAEALRAYDSGSDLMLYQSQYAESMARPVQRDRSRRAWIGTGIGLGVNIVLVSLLLASY